MANPDCDDGWIKLAHELGAAISRAGFTTGAQVMLYEVFAQVFGPARRPSATLSPSRMAHEGGRVRQFYDRGRRELMDSRVIRRLDDGTYRFLKDYERWTRPGGTPRLTPADVRYCKGAPGRAMAYRVASTDGVNQTDDISTKSVNQTDDISAGPVNEIDDTLSTGLMTNVNWIDDKIETKNGPPLEPPLVNAREFEKGELGEGERDSLSLSEADRAEAEERRRYGGIDMNKVWEENLGPRKERDAWR